MKNLVPRRHEVRRRTALLLSFALFTIFLLSSTGCSREEKEDQGSVETSTPDPLFISADDNDLPVLRSLLTIHPFPVGFIPHWESPSDGVSLPSSDLKITILMQKPESSGVDGDPYAEAEASGKTIIGSAVLGIHPLVPAVSLHDPRQSVDPADLADMRILPPEDLLPGEKALAVSGVYIDDPQYPLFEKEILVLEDLRTMADDSGPQKLFSGSTELKKWLDGISEIRELGHSPLREPDRQIRWIAGVGDIMVQRGIQDILISRGDEGLDYIFQDTLKELRSVDFLTGNLEGAVSYGGTPVPKSYNFRFFPKVLPYLKKAGFDYLSITNNHCYDYGTKGFTDTLDHLNDAGIATSGAGRTPEEAYSPYKTIVRDFPVKILSLGAYPRENNGFDGRSQASINETRPGIIFSGPKALDTIKNFAGPDSIDIVIAHGGKEWTSTPTKEQRIFYRKCIEAGADLLIGHHPHVLQGMEAYEGGLIAYSVGNFLFPGMGGMPHAEESMILTVGFLGDRPLYVQPSAVRIQHRRIALEQPNGPILHRFLDLGRALQAQP